MLGWMVMGMSPFALFLMVAQTHGQVKNPGPRRARPEKFSFFHKKVGCILLTGRAESGIIILVRKAKCLYKGAGGRAVAPVAKNLEMGYLLDFYGEVLTDKQREMMSQYYHDDLSLSEIGENFGITRQGARDAIKHGENTLLELENKVGFAARYRRVQQTLEELEQLVIDARFECTGPHARLTSSEYLKVLNQILKKLRSIDEVNES